MRYFLILAMFFALAQAGVSISTPNVFIDIGGGHYYKRGYKNHHRDHYRNRGYYKRGYIPRHHYRPHHHRPYSRW
ncbi:hypothetical protein [Campylobacter sp.]|uniref:hypothetical protein n=1 Tax=Campylobacter sp. TaxID=205 RepID=UPI002A5EE26D|nr:hypothetical protein [Campylobacter sp.]MDD7703214.1 hypothetical protein [Campylobacteraceae bacterium]MDY2635033.1 hypothetical protein [Campylobacter sp.]